MKKLYLVFFLVSFSFLSYSQTDCSTAATAAEGLNSFSATQYSNYWFTYELPAGKKVSLSSTNSAEIAVTSGTDCDNRTNYTYGYPDVTFSALQTGGTLYIRIYPYASGSFEFDLTISDIVPGEDCFSAVTAAAGTNSFSATEETRFWFTYELPAGKKISLSSANSGQILVTSGTSCNNKTNYTYGYPNVNFAALENGGTLYIRVNPYNTETFEFELLESDLVDGDNCSLAASAVEGSNSFSATDDVPYWLSFELPADKKLSLSSTNSGEIEVSTGSDCENRFNSAYGNPNITYTRLTNGGTVYIKVIPFNTETFEFDLTVSDFSAGDKCDLAVQAVAGVNTFAATNNTEFWYQYTMVEAGNLSIDFTGYNYFEAYKGADCLNMNFTEGSGNSTTLIDVAAGENIYIKWENDGGFDFTLTELLPASGDNCTLAETALEGTNSMPATVNDYFWYAFTMPADLDQKLIIEAGNDRDIVVYNGSCESLNALISTDGGLKVLGIAPDEEIYIRIYTDNTGDFDWSLAVEPVGIGDDCENPEEAVTGNNFTPVAPHWFTYTAPVAGLYTISSVGLATEDTYLRVYSDCQGSLINSNDDFSGLQSELSLSLTEDQTIYILWDKNYNAEAFDWSISSEAIPEEKLNQTITFNSLGPKTFGDADFELNGTASSGLDVGYSSSNTAVATVTGSTVTIVGAGSTIITSSQEGNFEYDAATPVEQTLTVNKANQSIAFDPIADMEITAADFTIPASVNSGLDLTYLVSGPATVSGNNLSLTGETGTVSITASQAGNDNYNVAESVMVEFLVTDPAKTDQTITFAALEPRTYGVLAINLSATASSGLTVSYESSNPSVASVDGSLLVINTAGSTTITAKQEGNGSFNPASAVSRELVINKADQTINIEAIGEKEIGDPDFDIDATVSSGKVLTHQVEGPATVSGKTISIGEETGTVTVTVSQAGDTNYNAATALTSFEIVNNRSDQIITITEIADKFTNAEPFELEASTTSELQLTYEVSGPATIEGTTITLDGTVGTVEVTVSQEGNENYNAATSTVSFEVTEDPCLDFAATATVTNLTCADGEDGSITVETTAGTAPFTYSLAGAAAVESNVFSDLATGDYTIEVTDVNGCTATTTATITSPDAIEITAEVESSNSILGNGSIVLTVSGGTGDYIYSWSNGATTASITDLEVGEYTVTVTDENDCSLEESFTIGGVTANEEALLNAITIYPNPAKDIVQLQHSEKAKSLKLYDARGKLLNEIATEGNRTELNVSHLPSGLYFIRQDAATQLYRFVKE